jgi:hypothetical protein
MSWGGEKKICKWLAALCLQTLALGAVAQEAYVAGGVGQSNWNFDCGSNGCDRNTTAWRAAAGYRFNRIVALEAFYFDFGRARSSSAALDGTLGGTAVGLEALIGWQFGAFDLAGKIGLASVRADFRPAPTSFDVATRVRNTEVIGGLMGAYRITPNVALRLDVDIVTVALERDTIFFRRGADVTTVLFGVALRF